MAVMKGRPVDICSLIADDIFEIVKSGSRTMGHASLIVELCKRAEVEDLSGGEIVPLTRAIDNNWIQRAVNEWEKDQQ
ncbi:hypothetical protein A2U01_0023058, partial [Trifolium medium]|nr:hypothetical protein [Trifolium medium]